VANSPKAVCVFCGSRDGSTPEFLRAANELGTAIGNAGMSVVYGGANIGLMGAVADAALAAGAEVIGIMPHAIADRGVAHQRLTRFEVVADMGDRKDRMVELADAFVTLPGGGGTYDELFEVFALGQLGLHQKPIVLCNIQSYFDPAMALVDHAIAHGFAEPQHRSLFTTATSGADAVAQLLKRG